MKLTIGEKITLLRKEKNITQTELAEYLFLTPQTISRWEVGSGAPEITLLPKIATFFGVSIDELFGITSMERVEDLVAKYSVLRDDRSFQDAMECIDSQRQTVEALLKSGTEDTAGLERDRDQLDAEKMHMWIQQGREAFRRAHDIAEHFVEKTEGNPEHPWYLRMRLQRDQLCLNMGRYRETLDERKQALAEHPDETALLRYLCVLGDLQNYEEILSIQRAEGSVQEIICPPSVKNLDIWWQFIHAAVEAGDRELVERYMPAILEVCSEQDEFQFLRCLLPLYRDGQQSEKLTGLRQRLLELLPKASVNKYFEENLRKQIEQ